MSALAWLAVGIFGPPAVAVGVAVLVESLRRPPPPRTPPPPRVPPTVVCNDVAVWFAPNGTVFPRVDAAPGAPWVLVTRHPSALSAVDRMAMAEQYDEIRALPETAER